MARFFPVYIRRSDGVLVVTARNGKREKNEPTPEQLDQTPDAKGVSDYYRLLSMNDAKYIDWMRKLGGMLIRELGGDEHAGPDKAYLLYQLPENYRLYEHIKTKAQPKDGGVDGASKAAKNHAGGNNERQDAYLYGHPLGKKKRYRSPGDFFPHLLWLATDPQGDPDNCACKVCAPDELQPEDDRVKPEPVKKEEDVKPRMQAHVVIEVPRPSPATYSSNPPTVLPSPSNQAPAKPTTAQFAAVPQTRPIDQQIDSQYNRFVYRPGEVVWFFKGAAWGLAVVARRFRIPASPTAVATKGYLVQPLSLPMIPEQQMPIFREEHMRPWLAWSPPGFTLQALQSSPNVLFENVDWQGALNGRYGDGDPQVDASILAARAMDGSYSLFGATGSNPGDQASSGTRWNGIFIGAEKFWVGDPVRLKPGSGRDVLIITEIIEQSQNGPSMQMQTTPKTYLVGNVYQPIEVPAGAPIPSEPSLPSRMREDMARRNAITLPAKRVQCYWKLMTQQIRVGLDAIKGRWYEASLLTPILCSEEEYTKMVTRGDIYEVGNMMNARGDAQSDPSRKAMPAKQMTRHEALGSSVPSTLVFMEGDDPLPQDELRRLQDRSNPQPQHGLQTEVQLDDIMDFGERGV